MVPETEKNIFYNVSTETRIIHLHAKTATSISLRMYTS